MKSKSNESKVETNLEARKTEEINNDRRQSPAVKPRTVDGSTPVEACNLGRVLNIINGRRWNAVCN